MLHGRRNEALVVSPAGESRERLSPLAAMAVAESSVRGLGCVTSTHTHWGASLVRRHPPTTARYRSPPADLAPTAPAANGTAH